jgi:hypothetical protein
VRDGDHGDHVPTVHATRRPMSDPSKSAPAPKKRSLFKRAAWQDAPRNDEEDMFSHSKDFKNIVAEQNRIAAEERRKAEQDRARKQATRGDSKRRKVSTDHDDTALPDGGADSSSRTARTGSTPLSPAPPHAPPDSLPARYDTLARSASAKGSRRDEPVVIELGDSDGESGKYPSRLPADDSDDEPEEQDPMLAAIAARARARVAAQAQAAATASGHVEKAPVVQLLISPEIPNTRPLMVKVRTDSTLEKARLAWCGKQGYTPEQTKEVYFTFKGARVYDSTTVRRLGIQIDAFGNVSVDGDLNFYNDENLPKVYVQAWTDALFQKHKEEAAAEAAAKKKAAELLHVKERTPTPEPVPEVKKLRLILKAKGKEDYKISVNPVGRVSLIMVEDGKVLLMHTAGHHVCSHCSCVQTAQRHR